MKRSIPPATQSKLDHPACPGERHVQARNITVALIDRGFEPDEIFALLRPNYEASGRDAMPDDEIWRIIDGVSRYPNLGQHEKTGWTPTTRTRSEPVPISPEDPTLLIKKIIKEFRCTGEEVTQRSPAKCGTHPWGQAARFLKALYAPDDLVNIVTQYRLEEDGKPQPLGYGHTLKLPAWLARFIQINGVVEGKAGAWIRMNPLDGKGIANRNVVDFKFALLEFDRLPVELQLAFFARVSLPIAALITSGGRSIHAWVRIDAPDFANYQTRVGQIFERLAPFRIDVANKNPSRLARLPGARRRIGASGDGLQRLLYLNPKPTGEPIYA